MLAFLSAWWNAPFLVALLVALGLMGFVFLGVAKDAPGDAAAPDLHGAGDLGAKEIPGGKAPMAIVAVATLLAFAVLGLLMNAVVWDASTAASPLTFPVVLVLASLGATTIARRVGAVLRRVLPAGDAEARQPGEHVGRVGVALSRIGQDVGQVRIDGDGRGPTAYIVAVSPPLAIDAGTEVLVATYDASRRLYTVVPTGGLQP